jgi:membrane protease YdiL (CAAX protease family)
VFSIAERTLLSDVVFNLTFMTAASCCIIAVSLRKGFDLAVLPARFSKVYLIATIVVAALFLSTPFVTQSATLYDILFLIYGAAVTPIYEELIFRGVVWEAVRVKNDKAAYLVSSLLFAVWHLGYVDTIIWRTSLFFPDADIFKIMLMKAVTGLVFGLVLGALRYKTRNAYSTMLLHCVMNTLGR